MTSSQPSNFAQLEAASEWFAVLSDPPVSEADRVAWQQWLNDSEEHRKAWSQVESVGAMFSSFQNDAMRQSAGYVLESGGSMNRRQLMKGVLGVTGVAALGWMGWNETPLPRIASAWMADFHTQVGQVAAYDLDAGNKIWLNTNSALNRVASSNRNFALLDGEALFHVTNGSDSRPFSVTCKHALMASTAENARFCLRHLPNQGAVLAVYEGRVSLSPLGRNDQTVIRAGEQAIFTKDMVGDRRPVLAMYESWRNGLLIVDDMPLAEFVAEIGRYRHGFINLDPAVASLRVVGTFPTQDANLVFDMLENTFDIQVKRLLPWWTSITVA
ncbi:DUF4880 domain-containing protein [Marinomonas pontica]|uniref:DUF4880 domain-containing protein n=1 Tax=Marinomonas pontica TaxID=264739 RepID=UPI0022442418|nr:DUF4880 domain-containing protein [Marinomonas pontica]MCW8356716.1 DUF4880 domain-containing protein [Marinomonas pontica]